MDDLYDDLENYNDANVIEELRNENQQLKAKVEKCTATLEKLQKDFDKLEAEYKKLERNYSSLLKTARAEVERKTQIITSLNHEKDMMVLNAIQNKNVLNIRRNCWMGKANNNQPRDNNVDSNNKKTTANQPKTRSSSSGRKEASQTPSEETTTTASTENVNQLKINNEKSVSRASDVKENVGESVQKSRPARAGSIRSRRKSMPATRFNKFSSDEEGEISSPPRNTKANEPLSRENNQWGGWDRNYSRQDRQDSYNRVRNYDNDKFRNRDRFEAQRNRYSPERFHRRSKKDYLVDNKSHRLFRDGSGGYRSDKDGEQKSYRDGSGDYRQNRDRSGDCRPRRDGSGDHIPRRDDSGDRYQRPEHRKRRLESPPRDKYYQYQQKNHEQFEKDYYDERNKYLEDPTRVKYLSDYDEPSHKRLRTESHHSSEQDSRGHRGQDPASASQHVVGTLVRDDMSCQSPDYPATELATVPKEIKLDTEGKLDDPRELSNNYTIRMENGKKVLSTVVGRNIDLQKVPFACNIPKVEIPKALVLPPSQYSETINNIYDNMDVDNQASGISSVESGETMGSIYDIANDPCQYTSKQHHKNNFQQRENVENFPLSGQEGTIQKGVKNPKKPAIATHNNNLNLQVCEKEIMQMDNVDECPSSEKPAIHTENVAKTQQSYDKDSATTEKSTTKNESLQTSEKRKVSTEKVAEASDIHSEYVAIQTEKVAEVSQNCEKVDKKTEKVKSTCKITSNFGKSKYKIPKINRDNSGSRERKHLDDKPTKNRETDKHDNISKTRVVDEKERKHDQVPVVVTEKGMVEGDLELSDENSDNIELVKRVTKEIEEQSMPDLNKPNIEKVLDTDSKKEAADSIKQISPNDHEKNIVPKERTEQKTRRESIDSNNKSKSKGKEMKQTQVQKADNTDALNKETKQKIPETVMSRDIKNKFSDLFGDTSSLITPEDLGLTATEIRIESSSSNYFPIFEDAQDAIDLGAKVTTNTNISLSAVSNKELCIDKAKSSKKEVHNKPFDVNEAYSRSKSRKLTDKYKDHSAKPMDSYETKSKCSKNTEKEKQQDKKIEANESKQNKHLEKQHHGNKKIDVGETKPKSKSRKNTDTGTEATTHKLASEHCENANKRTEVEEQKQKSKSSKNTEHLLKDLDGMQEATGTKSTKITEEHQQQHSVKKVETEDVQTNSETKRRKSRRNEEKTQLTIDTTETPQPAVITVEKTTPAPTGKIDPNDIPPKEPDVVKTVIISSGVQPIAQEVPVNNFSPILLEPPVTPNIDSRQTRVDIPLLSHSVHIHALATSTPAKEIALKNVQEDVNVCGTPDVSNASDQASQSNVNSYNDMEAPDVRIFVKRRKRVVKKTTPSKT